MDVLLESEDQMACNGKKRSGKRRRPSGPPASSPATVADETGVILKQREAEWLERLTHNPASFAAVEREVHDQAQRQADRYVAGLLAKASDEPAMAQHVDQVMTAAEVPLRLVEKKGAPWWSALWAAWRSR